MDAPKSYKQTLMVTAIQWTGENATAVQKFLYNGHPHAADGWVKGRYVEVGAVGPDGRPTVAMASVGSWLIRGYESISVMTDDQWKLLTTSGLSSETVEGAYKTITPDALSKYFPVIERVNESARREINFDGEPIDTETDRRYYHALKAWVDIILEEKDNGAG